MKKISSNFGALSIAVLLLAACNSEDEDNRNVKRQDIVLTKAQTEYVESGNELGLELLANQFKENNGACLISPLSSQIALGMLAPGAAGETQDQIVSTLGFGDDATATIQYLSTLTKQLKEADRKTDLEVSNMLLTNTAGSTSIKQDYIDLVSEYSDAELYSANFFEDRDQIIDKVNSWSSKHTGGRIPALMSENDLNELAKGYIINALYFKSKWSSPFSKEETKNDKFTYLDGKEDRIPMMHKTSDFSYYEDDDLQALQMDYGNGAFAYTAILPKDAEDLEDILDQLSEDLYEEILSSSSTCKVSVSLPKYKREVTVNMIPLYISAGLTLPFTKEADLSNMLEKKDKGYYVTDFTQKVYIDVDESGAEAAATSKLEIGYVTAPPVDVTKPKVFKADHPFVYLITETSTGTILFAGIYN